MRVNIKLGTRLNMWHVKTSQSELNLARCTVVCLAMPKNSCAFSSSDQILILDISGFATCSALAHFGGSTASGSGRAATQCKPSLFAVTQCARYTSAQRQIQLASARCVLKCVPGSTVQY